MATKKYLTYLTSICLFIHSTLPCYPTHFSTIDEVEKKIEYIKSVASVPTALTFKSTPGKTAAGVLHYYKKNGETYFLLGERDTGTLSNLGGMSDVEVSDKPAHPSNSLGLDITHHGDLSHTASREVREESNNILCFHPRLIKQLPFIDVVSENENGLLLHRLYFQKIKLLTRYS
jgi:hypothetical protein